MKKEDYNHQYDVNIEDERRFSGFLENACYALIAATWALGAHVPAEAKGPWFFVLCLCVGFLIVRGVGHFANVSHNRKILKAEHERPGAYKDGASSRTVWGKTSLILYYLEPIILIIAAVMFIGICFKITYPF